MPHAQSAKSSVSQLAILHPERRAEVPGPWGRACTKVGYLSKKPCHSLPFLPVHRQHFPFFQTAPEGWKNTIRHNLCFRDSFEKVPVSMQGGASTRPRSCLWKLTEEGHRRFEEEARALASTQLESIQQCMSQPGVRPCHKGERGEPEGRGPEDPDLRLNCKEGTRATPWGIPSVGREEDSSGLRP